MKVLLAAALLAVLVACEKKPSAEEIEAEGAAQAAAATPTPRPGEWMWRDRGNPLEKLPPKR